MGNVFKDAEDELDAAAEGALKDELSGDRNKRQIVKTEAYLESKYTFRRNKVSNEIEFTELDEDNWRDLSEVELNNMWRDFQHHKIPFGKSKTIDLLKSSFVPDYDPFVQYFEDLEPYKPNKEIDYIEKLASYVNTTNKEAFTRHFKKHLVRTVKCAIDPDYFNKHALILVQEKQHGGKSTFCRFLCPPVLQKYYTEELTIDKDGLIAICENFIINMDELAVLSRAEINTLKTIISKLHVKVRQPFEKKAQRTSRRCSFVGSTNDRQFLTDHTGSVRWICFEVNEIDFAYADAVDINRVYAQAYYLMKNGFNCSITKEEVEENELRNKEFKVTGIEMDIITKYFDPCSEDVATDFMTSADIMTFIQSKVGGQQVKMHPVTIGKVMNELGFVRGSKSRGTFSVKGYFVRKLQTLEYNKTEEPARAPEEAQTELQLPDNPF